MSDVNRIKANTAGELTEHFELSDEAECVAVLEDAPVQVIAKLLAEEKYHDAVTMLAHALPKREAVWWVCLAVRKELGPEDKLDAACVVATELWVREPSELNRKAAKKLGDGRKKKSAAAWSATAASWCTGNMLDDDATLVAPPDFLYAHAVAAGITLAAVAAGPKQMAASYQLFMRQGFDLAAGGSGQVPEESAIL
ncbi:hypothetical protein A9Q89_04435 [Gammaproteobacteria bacterium 53_120_T64]|nr:hypothetical protein A9Q89_04435 [Gammaproteobacteria bacterium 53_120_T64]